MTHNELIKYAYKWLKKEGCTLIATEFVTSAHETPDAIGWNRGGESYLIECKTSLNDFKQDKVKVGNRLPDLKMGNVKYYFCTLELADQIEDLIPDDWGLLSVHMPLRKPIFSIIKQCPYNKTPNKNDEVKMMMSAFRRLKVKKLTTGMAQ